MSTTLEPNVPTGGFRPEPVSSRIFVRCYRHDGEAKRAYDQLRVVARIPDRRMTVVARGLEWREPLSVRSVYKLACGIAALTGAAVGLVPWALGPAAADVDWLMQTVCAAATGAAVGFCVATAVVALRGRRNGVAETGHVEPGQYDILVEEDLAPVARATLGVD